MAEQEGSVGMKSDRTRVLVSGASFAGLATAYWMNRLGYRVTIVEIAATLRKGGTPVDIEGATIDIVRRMGLLDAIRSASLPPRATEFKNADDITEARLAAQPTIHDGPEEKYEIDRDALLEIMWGAVAADVEIVFDQSVTRLKDEAHSITAWFDNGSRQDYAFVFGCDGTRSNTRRLVFGDEDGCSYFLKQYFFIKVVNKMLIDRNITQIYSVPGKTVMLNGYDGKTDIVFSFHSEQEIPYDHRDKTQQSRLVRERFDGAAWRTQDLLKEVAIDDDFYFDKLCQIRMPAWTKGRVALVGDAGYCPSPAAGMGGSMAIVGAAALADSFQRHGEDFTTAFRDYDESLRPFVDEVQEQASFHLAMFFPETEEGIIERNRTLAEM